MKIYSHNIWNYNPHGFGYEPLWQRMKLISELIFEADADVCMFQECGPETCRAGKGAIQKLLEEKYSEVCPEKADVNYTPVFYKKEKSGKFYSPLKNYLLNNLLNSLLIIGEIRL